MSERNYYVFCDDNCKFEGMTKEQIIAAIAEATGTTPVHIDDAFITKIKEQNGNKQLKFWVGTQAEYNALQTKPTDCYVLITDDTTLDDLNAEIASLQETIETLQNSLKYHAGDTLYFNSFITNGYVTTGCKSLNAFIPLSKQIGGDVRSIRFGFEAADARAFSITGYIIGGTDVYENLASDGDYNVTMTREANGIRIRIEYKDSTLTFDTQNNTPVSLEFVETTIIFG